MSGDLRAPRALFVDPAGQSGLEAALAAAWPGVILERAGGAPAGWLQAVLRQEHDALVVAAEGCEPGSLRALGALLPARPGLDVLLVCGPRGLAGCEDLLAHPRARAVPDPWTPRALAAAVASLRGDPAPADPRAAAPPRAAAADAGPAAIARIEDRLERLGRIEEELRSRGLELAAERDGRRARERQDARDGVLRGAFALRDRLAELAETAAASACAGEAAAALRAVDDFLAAHGILREDRPAVEDADLGRIVGRRPLRPGEAVAGARVRRPAYYRLEDGRRRVLRPAEIEILEPAPRIDPEDLPHAFHRTRH